MNNKKISINIIEAIEEEQRKIGSLQWQFLKDSLSPDDLKMIKEMGIEVYVETECIDERAAAQTILTGKIRLEINIPGGGFDYLNKEEIRSMLKLSDGQVVLDPHRGCGWGGLRMNFYQSFKGKINSTLPNTTLLIGQGYEYKDGIDYLQALIKTSFSDNNFLNSVMRSAKLQTEYNFRKDFERALEEAFPSAGIFKTKDANHKDLIEIAFAYGKMLEIKRLLEIEASNLGYSNNLIRLNPDMLFDQPHSHIAKSAIFNLTDRKLLRRFSIHGSFAPAFFSDISKERLLPVLDVVVSIMEGEHSSTKDQPHDIYIICNEAHLDEVKDILNDFENKPGKLKTPKQIFIHLIENNESPKSREELLWLIR